MSILEQKKVISSIHPFQNLTSEQLDTFVENMDIVYFKKNETVQAQGSTPQSLFFILKGNIVYSKNKDELRILKGHYLISESGLVKGVFEKYVIFVKMVRRCRYKWLVCTMLRLIRALVMRVMRMICFSWALS